MNSIFVALGGFIGSIVRYMISLKVNKKMIGTFIVNVTGSLLLAIILLLYMKNLITYSLFLFLGVGFCGAYTTFSTFGNELLTLTLSKNYFQAFVYIITSIGLSILFVALVLYICW